MDRPPAPTFAEYIPVVSAAVSAGTRRVYSSYWNRITEHWAQRRLDEPTPTEIKWCAPKRTVPAIRCGVSGLRSTCSSTSSGAGPGASVGIIADPFPCPILPHVDAHLETGEPLAMIAEEGDSRIYRRRAWPLPGQP